MMLLGISVAFFYRWLLSTGWDHQWFQVEIWMGNNAGIISLYAVVLFSITFALSETLIVWRKRHHDLHPPHYKKRFLQFMSGLTVFTVIMGSLAVVVRNPGTAKASGCAGTTTISTPTTWSTNQCLGDVTVSSTLTIAGNTTHDLISLTLTGGNIIIEGDTLNGAGVTINVDNDVTLSSGSVVATGKGYQGGGGPGSGGFNAGGSHGGQGGNNTTSTYGSITAPVTLGSGGGGASASNGLGGAAIKFNIGGNLSSNISISANGTDGSLNGGGAGGSVWINFTGVSSTWSGYGSIYAVGGGEANSSYGGGAGGRIAVTGYVTDTHSGSLYAYAGSGTGIKGSAGTIYTKSASQTYGSLLIDNASTEPGSTSSFSRLKTDLTLDSFTNRSYGRFLIESGYTLTIPSGSNMTGESSGTVPRGITQNEGTLSLGGTHTISQKIVQRGTLNVPSSTITLASPGMLSVDAATTLGTVTVQSGAIINHSDNSTAETYKMDLSVGNLTINSGGAVNVVGLGYDSGSGTGKGTSIGGGGYGGQGGTSTGGDTYGSALTPDKIGSGGAISSSTSGMGGGAIKLTISGNLTNNGTITASGQQGSLTGAGSGGSVWIVFTGGSSTWGGSGTIYAEGSYEANSSYGKGGGGRIAVTGYSTDSHSGAVSAATAGGASGVYGGVGTIYTKTASQTYGSLLIDGQNRQTDTRYGRSGETSLTLDGFTVQNYGTFNIPTGSTLTLPSGVNLAGNISASKTINEGTLVLSGTHTISHNLIQRGTLTATGSTVTVGSTGILTVDVPTTMHNVTVNASGKITHSDNSTAETYKLDLTLNNLTLSSGTIDVDGLGYDAGYGPGAGGVISGAGHGGMGGGASSGQTYGTATAPTSLGSGGYGSSGGGAVKLTINGNFSNSGQIRAQGTGGGVLGTGSGGSIWVNFTGASSTWSGTGSIIASGGSESNSSYGNGAGGRIAVTGYVTDTHSGTPQTFSGGGAGKKGAAGTVYTKSASQTNGSLRIDNNGNTPEAGIYTRSGITNLTLDGYSSLIGGTFEIPTGSTLTIPSGVDLGGNSASGYTYVHGTLSLAGTHTIGHTVIQRGTLNSPSTTITINQYGTLRVDSATTLGSVTVQNLGDIDHSDNSTAETYKMDLTVTNLTVNSGGTVNLNGLGYDAGNGPGAGGVISGAGHGGMGGGSSGGDTYGSAVEPATLGSGGYSGVSGGGAGKITLSGNLSNAGTISANGTNGSIQGAGAGGSLWIHFTGASSAWSGAGSITANGGSEANSSYGNGGGGRIAVTGYVTDTHSGTVSAYGGSGSGVKGAAGTIFYKTASETNGRLVIDAGSITTGTDKYTKSNVSSLTVDGYVIQNSGVFQIPSGSTLTLASTGSTTHNSGSTLLNRGTFTSTGFSHTISGTFIADGTTTFGDVTIASGGTLTHSDNSTADTYRMNITASSVSVNAGGLIDANGLGRDGGAADAAGNGSGAGSAGGSASGGGGGGYGGAGSNGVGSAAGFGGSTYGSANGSTLLGSGGGGGDSDAGGSGGGSIQITTTGNLTVAGTIRANGSVGGSVNYGGGGGSGGSIYLTVGGNFNCSSGTVTANGGNGGGSLALGGGGGGGRITRAVTGTYTDCSSITVSTGTGGSGGSDGTNYVPVAPPTGFAAGTITSSSIEWSVADASTTETHFRLYNDADDALVTNTASTTSGGTGSTYNLSDTGLTPNTTYTRYATAYDGSLDSLPTSSVAATTLASVPGAPTVTASSTSSLTVVINVNSNPASTEFAIYESTTDKYVQADGTLGASVAWQTYTNWGGASGTSTSGLSANTSYSFQVKARNSSSTETALSSAASKYTHAIVPGIPVVASIGATSFDITLAADSNPAATQYAISITYGGDTFYVQSDGTLGATASWQTMGNWDTISATLPLPNTQYDVAAKSRNGDNVESASSAAESVITDAATPSVASVEPISSTSIRIKLNPLLNPWATEFAIYNDTLAQYVTISGGHQASPAWATYADWGGATGIAETGLAPSTLYTYKAKARNSEGTEASFSASKSTTTSVASTTDSGSSSSATPTPSTSTTPTPGASTTPTGTAEETENANKSTPTPAEASSPTASPTIATAIVKPIPLDSEPDTCFYSNAFVVALFQAVGQCQPIFGTDPVICFLFCDTKLDLSLSPAGDNYDNPINVAATYLPATHLAEIFYTINGKQPNRDSILYRSPIYLKEDTTIKAKAFGSSSEIVTETYTFTSGLEDAPLLSNPSTSASPESNESDSQKSSASISIQPDSGEYKDTILATITAGGGSHIEYTTDGSDPRVYGLPYHGRLTISQPTVLSAVVKTDSGYSEVARKTYTFTSPITQVIVSWSPEDIVSEEELPVDITYEAYCNDEKIGETKDTQYTDAVKRFDGCTYTVMATDTGSGAVLGQVSNLTIQGTTNVKGLIAVSDSVATAATALSATALGLILIHPVASGIPSIHSFLQNIPQFFHLLWLYLLVFVRIKKPGNVMGRVYEVGTNLPVSLAKIQLFEVGKKKQLFATVTNLHGEFNIRIAAGNYELKVVHPDYHFPSKYAESGYVGGTLLVESQTEVMIPLDPHNRGYVITDYMKAFTFDIEKFHILGLLAGSSASLILFLRSMSTINTVMFLIYALLWWRESRSRYMSYNAVKVEHKSARFIEVVEKMSEKIIAQGFVDKLQNFYAFIAPGEYDLKILNEKLEEIDSRLVKFEAGKHRHLVAVMRRGIEKVKLPKEK